MLLILLKKINYLNTPITVSKRFSANESLNSYVDVVDEEGNVDFTTANQGTSFRRHIIPLKAVGKKSAKNYKQNLREIMSK